MPMQAIRKPLKQLLPVLLAGGLTSTLVSACGPVAGVLGLGASTPGLSAFTRLADRYEAGGYGNDLEGNLLLIVPNEVLRFDRTSSQFTAFGGPTTGVDAGRIQRDQADTLYLIGTNRSYHMPKGSSQWQLLDTESKTVQALSSRTLTPAPPRLLVSWDGTQVLVARFAQNQGQEVGNLIFRRDNSDSAWRLWVETIRTKSDNVDLGESDQLGMRKDGTLLYKNEVALFALKPTDNKPQKVLDCSVIVGSYCNLGLTLITNPASEDVYLANASAGEHLVFRLPGSAALPLVPVSQPALPGDVKEGALRFWLDRSGQLWGALDRKAVMEKALSEYSIDVTRVSRLESSSWKIRGHFLTPNRVLEPGLNWGSSEDGQAIYSYGFQIGRTLLGWPVSEAILK